MPPPPDAPVSPPSDAALTDSTSKHDSAMTVSKGTSPPADTSKAIPESLISPSKAQTSTQEQDVETTSTPLDLIDLEPRSNDAAQGSSSVVEKGSGHADEAVATLEQALSDTNTSTDGMESSVATLKPSKPPLLSVDTSTYIDPTPPTPSGSQTHSRSSSAHKPRAGSSPTPSESGYDDKRYASEDEQEGNSQSEIQSIMLQFPEGGGGPGEEEVMSPRLEITSPIFGGPPAQHPPRKSSLEPLSASMVQQLQDLKVSTDTPASLPPKEKGLPTDDQGPPVPPKDGHLEQVVPRSDSTSTMHRPPPPEAEPEPALPFDFHRFLDQLKNKKADPVARYLKSFLSEFGKRQWMVHEQVKIIGDFLAFIANKMAQCEVWRDVSEAEFDNAREGMEKLVMNRLYSQTFSPAIAPPQPIPGARAKRRGDRPMGPGRRGQHQEDVERDGVLAQKISIYSWVREEHLDIPAVSDSGRRFLNLAQQELLKIKSYRAPRDKIICVLNCCKVIFGLLKHAKSDSSADSFMPLLIYVVLRANPEHFVSNVQYILRFRNQDKLGGEAGYYLSSLMGAVQFIENMDRTTLTITDEEFEKHVEAAVSAIAEKHRAEESPVQQGQPTLSEKGAHSQGSSTRPSLDVDSTGTPRRYLSSMEASNDSGDEGAIPGLLRAVQRPLSSIGRMFSDEPDMAGPSSASRPPPQHQSQNYVPSRLGPQGPPSRQNSEERSRSPQLTAQEAAARQASAEVAEAQRVSRAEHQNVVETLAGMFPDLDRDIISDVVYQKEGRVGLAVDACLALSS